MLRALLILLAFSALGQAAEFLDRIVAVVEDDVILESELERQVQAIERQLEAQGSSLPRSSLRRQVLERLILQSLQIQLAKRQGIQVDDEMLRQALLDLAQRNGMDLTTFRRAVENEGMDYTEFVENLRQELMLNRLRASQISARIQVSDREIDHFLATEARPEAQAVEYRLGHILIAIPAAASPKEVQQARQKAERLVAELQQGLDFQQAAIALSAGDQALKGGDLGWRKLEAIPSLFADLVPSMQKGEIRGPIQSPSGFHIIKLLDVKGKEADLHTAVETHVRHILLQPNEVIDDAEAQKRLKLLKQKLAQGEDFAALARAYSDDKSSSVKGGDLGWVTPEAVVPAFREAMDRLAPGEISDPVQTPFGWHLIQVLERKTYDDTAEYRRKRAKDLLTQRKFEEEVELWLQKLRAESYVEILLDE
jgi:peptidyl-prolyl cis-trans isomerase SurA